MKNTKHIPMEYFPKLETRTNLYLKNVFRSNKILKIGIATLFLPIEIINENDDYET